MKPVLDPFAPYRAATRARIGMGRAGDAVRTGALLDFQAAHARARDAVHGTLDVSQLEAQLAPLPSLRVHSRAEGRDEYLRRPDRGRRLAPDSAQRLTAACGTYDLSLVIADGLSPAGVTRNAASIVRALLQHLPHLSWAPLVLAEQARVALGDEIGALLGARYVAVMIGERPGLSVGDSVGIYLTREPRIGRTDAERNCISNIHADGLTPAGAADLLKQLLQQAELLKLTGVNLKVGVENSSRLSFGNP